MRLALWLILAIIRSFRLPAGVHCQINRAPHFSLGGDMARFSISEDTIPGTIVYTLHGVDPEYTNVSYSISGQYFTVNKFTGNVTLVKPLDREEFSALEVIINITDEPLYGSDSNTVSIKREIPILDVNDNAPEFVDRPYYVSVSENTKPDTLLYSNIRITDKDNGLNSEIILSCVNEIDCSSFSVDEEQISEGTYKGMITLLKKLDYETQPVYNLILKATDSNAKHRLTSTVSVAVEVQDVQDQPPVFIGAPYSIAVQENVPPNSKLLTIEAKDGDTKNRRPVTFAIENDNLGYFKLINHGNDTASVLSTNVSIDREHPNIAENGDIYTFVIKATELINNQVPDDESFEIVSVVVLDVDDQLPEFNSPFFKINVSEDISKGAPLPGLDVVVTDNDSSRNSEFFLSVKSVVASMSSRSDEIKKSIPNDWFSVEPVVAVGKTAVILRITNSSNLDYDNDIRKKINVIIAASVNINGSLREVSSSNVQLDIVDANDNAPEFRLNNYVLRVHENATPGIILADNITAEDYDSGLFARIEYSLHGFGIDRFATNATNGGIILIGKLDYEQQSSYSLTLEATDGGGLSSTANIWISIVDVNDNVPIFEQTEYRRIVREASSAFYPRLFVKATDADSGANSVLTYTIVANNTDAIDLDENTGELTFKIPSSSKHTDAGQYELKVRATDGGIPALFAEVDVYIRVGIPGNQKPIFKGTPYVAKISETAVSGTSVIFVVAADPDGPNDIEYRIVAEADNFNINPKSGLITVSETAVLDLDITQSPQYKLSVLAIDKGVPFPETAEATVVVNIVDVNNKVPRFPKIHNYIRHISEDSPIGEIVLNVEAVDSDSNADLRYKIVHPIFVRDKKGLPLVENLEDDFRHVFAMDEKTGTITVNASLNYLSANTIVMTVEARDKNALVDADKQFDRVEVTFYIESSDKVKPIFSNNGWSISNPVINGAVAEESVIGFTVLQLTAFESITGKVVQYFRTISPVPKELVMDSAGTIFVAGRIDYETMSNKTFVFAVEAFASDNITRSSSKVVIDIVDINDHAPQFRNQSYHVSIRENSKKESAIYQIEATDGDLITSPAGYGTVRYSLTGDHAFLFEIDRITGVIKVSNDGYVIDREDTPVLYITAIAYDTPEGGIHQRRTTVPMVVNVSDVNDNIPIFSYTVYSSVLLENAMIGTIILNVTAVDLDEGISGKVTYEMISESDSAGLFSINSTTGHIKIAKSLIGKGRKDPYVLTVIAEDGGEPTLSAEATARILVTDVTENDGIPMFIRPTLDEIVYVSENSSVGSIVFQVKATDPDDPADPEGQLRYLFLDNGDDLEAFHIDSETGLITTRLMLDRELKDHYYLVIVVKDSAAMPRQVTRVLHIVITDVDDNVPILRRHADENPLTIMIEEEIQVGTVVGSLKAYDADSDANAIVGFLIIDGNEGNLFSIEEVEATTAVIKVSSRIDREKVSTVTLIAKSVQFANKSYTFRKAYNRHDLSEREVIIKILDVDDNAPEFEQQNITIGVRSNIPVDTFLLSVRAVDVDVNSKPVTYRIVNCSYVFRQNKTVSTAACGAAFDLNNATGEIRSIKSLAAYADGYFLVQIFAFNGGIIVSNRSYVYVKMFITHHGSFLRFVFDTMPAGEEVKSHMKQFTADLEDALSRHALKFNAYDTSFHSYKDENVNLARTSSCFQIISENGDNPMEMETLLKNTGSNIKLRKTYDKYRVQTIQHCGPHVLSMGKNFTWIHVSVIAVGTVTAILFAVLICFMCCIYSK